MLLCRCHCALSRLAHIDTTRFDHSFSDGCRSVPDNIAENLTDAGPILLDYGIAQKFYPSKASGQKCIGTYGRHHGQDINRNAII